MWLPITRGKETLVDCEDVEFFLQYKWFAQATRRPDVWYAGRHLTKEEQIIRGCPRLYLHRAIAERIGIVGDFIDHIDGNGLNNTRSNLRGATRSQNSANARKPRIAMSSRFKGVCFQKAMKKWQVSIHVGEGRETLGWFMDEEEAARAYDKRATEIFGDFAMTNARMGLL